MGSKNKLSMLSHMFPIEIAIWGYPIFRKIHMVVNIQGHGQHLIR